jgi:hypothetical protein
MTVMPRDHGDYGDSTVAHFLYRLIKSQVPFSALHLLYERFV